MTFDVKKEISNLNRELELDASNADSSSSVFAKRAVFKEFAYSSWFASQMRELMGPIRDFEIFENFLYGRINTDFMAVSPDKVFLSNLRDSDLVANYFAATAFQRMKDEINRDILAGNIPDDIPFISEMKAHRAFEDINEKYNSWALETLAGSFIPYLEKFNKKNDIVDFDSFIAVFKEHLKMIVAQLGPVTFSSFCLAGKSNIRNSGLAIEIANLNFSKDSDKIEFASNPYFKYYLAKADKHGFFVDYNAPWRLILNLSSPVITENPSWRGTFGFFDSTFNLSSNNDLEILKNLFLRVYGSLIIEFPVARVARDKSGTACVKRGTVAREAISQSEFDKKYPDQYWLKTYIDIKNVEKNLNFNRRELNKIKKTALDYKKHVDIHRAMSYISNTFQDIPSVEGSYYSLLNKQFYRDQDPLPFEDFDKFIREVVKSYKQK
tara:strand:+ start:3520 stop:4833 length:1314 start_codon:yes stop_codon:yes gene_type:complete